jgi:MFS family permease
MGLAICIYLSAQLDRGNLGNARLQGLEADALRGSDTNYSISLALFYVSYIVFAIPGTMASKRFLPSTALGVGSAIWALGVVGMAGTMNPAGVFVCRLVIGIGEASFGMAVSLTTSYWYTKPELAKVSCPNSICQI